MNRDRKNSKKPEFIRIKKRKIIHIFRGLIYKEANCYLNHILYREGIKLLKL